MNKSESEIRELRAKSQNCSIELGEARELLQRSREECAELKNEIRKLEMMVYDASQLVKTRGKW